MEREKKDLVIEKLEDKKFIESILDGPEKIRDIILLGEHVLACEYMPDHRPELDIVDGNFFSYIVRTKKNKRYGCCFDITSYREVVRSIYELSHQRGMPIELFKLYG